MTISPAAEQISGYLGKGIGVNNNGLKKDEANSFSDIMNLATNGNESFQNDKKYKDDYMENLPTSGESSKACKSDNNYTDDRVRKLEEKSDTNVESSNKSNNNVNNRKEETNQLESSNDNGENKVSDLLKGRILNKIADELDVDIEELEEILGQLGLEITDLLIPDNVSKLVSEVLGEGNVSDILMNENISDSIININSGISEILSDDVMVVQLGDTVDNLPTMENSIEEILNPIKDNYDSKDVSEEPLLTSDKESEETLGMDIDIENTNSEKEVSLKKDDRESHTESNTESDNNSFNEFVPSGDIQNNSINEIVLDNKDMSYSSIDPEEILSQVRDSIKAEITEEIKELSIHLNPENLGNVHLTVTAKEGAVTAMLLTENEAVQSALEAQIALIKDSLNEQGVKIEAIEVMVGAHEFEQNLDENNSQNEAQEKMEAQLKKATRKLNLGDLYADDIIEDLDEDEIVTAKMMAADGNMMDYKV